MPQNSHRRWDEEGGSADRESRQPESADQNRTDSAPEKYVKQVPSAPEFTEWEHSKDAAIKALPNLRQAAKLLRSRNALVETPQTRKARADLERLFQLYPDLRPIDQK
jgi:hypothetical protein